MEKGEEASNYELARRSQFVRSGRLDLKKGQLSPTLAYVLSAFVEPPPPRVPVANV